MKREEVIQFIEAARNKGETPDLSGFDLSETNLSMLDLRGTILSGPLENLIGADLRGADLSNADLSHTLFKENPLAGLHPYDDIVVAKFDGETKFPEGISYYSETVYDSVELEIPETRLEIARLSPSFKILEKLLEAGINLDTLNWREFEELIAELLTKDGYQVELGPGRNDGGVDLIATKDLENSGLFKAIWQAKMKQPNNKVGIEIIRELADTRNEYKASKAIIATTTYLTRGALERVTRDGYLLGKVDRDDLMRWINKVLHEHKR